MFHCSQDVLTADLTFCVLVHTGFHDLSQDDQLILIKTGFFEIWLAQHTRLFSSTDNTLLLGDGAQIPFEELELVFTVSKDDSVLLSWLLRYERVSSIRGGVTGICVNVTSFCKELSQKKLKAKPHP